MPDTKFEVKVRPCQDREQSDCSQAIMYYVLYKISKPLVDSSHSSEEN